MRLISAHDLRTGAGFVLDGNARCVDATAGHHDNEIDRRQIDPASVKPLGSCVPGSIVYVEWARTDRWLKLRVVGSA